MAKIAAVILPASRERRLPELCHRVSQSLSPYVGHFIETECYRGSNAVCALIRVGPDPLNPDQQPVVAESVTGVVCGYYVSPEDTALNSAQRLVGDIAAGGIEMLQRADGVYAFACWDSKRECLVTGVDKLGMRPLYWMSLPCGGYALASEIKALVGLADELDIDWAAWEEQLTFGFLFGEHTFFRSIKRFGVAESITFRHNGHESRMIEHFLETIDITERSEREFIEEQGAVFDRAMSRLSGLYDVGRDTMLTLSGGFDSRRALGWLLNRDIRPNAYTVPDVGIDGGEYESSIVRDLCRATGLTGYSVYPSTGGEYLHALRIRDLATDFESDEHSFSAILAMGLNCDDKVNFDGLGAGSQLSGAFVTRATFEPGGQEQFLAALKRTEEIRRTWLRLPESDAPPLQERLRTELNRWGDNPNRFAYFYLLSRTRREIALAPLSIQANIFESLCPYLDRDMMRSALSFPPTRKIDANMQMRLIEALHPALGALPTAHSPGIASDHRYRIAMGRVEQSARRKLLGEVSGISRSRLWSCSMQQRMRFHAARPISLLDSHRRLRWEFGKAAKVGQLAHFEKISQSPAHYEAATKALKATLGQHTDWCKPL